MSEVGIARQQNLEGQPRLANSVNKRFEVAERRGGQIRRIVDQQKRGATRSQLFIHPIVYGANRFGRGVVVLFHIDRTSQGCRHPVIVCLTDVEFNNDPIVQSRLSAHVGNQGRLSNAGIACQDDEPLPLVHTIFEIGKRFLMTEYVEIQFRG